MPMFGNGFWCSLVFLLLIANTLSAFGVVTAAYYGRQYHVALNESIREKTLLEDEYGRLLLEKNTWISPAEIELVASQKLKMQAPKTAHTIVIGK